MSSAGQVVGGIVGGVIGFFAGGNVMLGVSIGASIGGYIDPPKGANTVGPRLEDLTVQTSTYGAVLPRIKGTVAVTGNVFWLEGDKLKEHTKTEKVGGKGGPTSKQTTFSYSATFAVGLSHQISAPVSGIRRLWLANTLVYDAGSGDINSIIASNQQAGVMLRFYDGRDDQEPDPRIQADKGVANVSGYPGRCYIVFYDLDLTEKYNNTLMATQAKVELVCGGPPSPAHYTAFTTPNVGYLTNNGLTSSVVSAHVSENKTTYAVSLLDASYHLYGFEFYEASYGEYIKKTGSIDLDVHFSYGHTAPALLLIQDTRDGVVSIVVSQGLYLSSETVFWFISNGSISQSRAYTDAEVDYGYYNIGASDAVYTFMADTGTAKPIIGFTGTTLYATSVVSIHASAIALSESYVFVSNYAGGPGAVTVTVLNRLDLSLVANYTQSVNGNGRVAFHVISDTEFYLASGQSLSHWVGGVATDLGGVLSAPAGSYPFRQINVSSDPDFYIDFHGSSGNYELAGVLTNFTVSSQPAKLRDIVTEECALAGIQASDLDLTELVNSDVRGYRVSQAGSVRTVLEQLQAAFPFDVIQSGYKLKFKSRGGASVLTVPESDLGAHTGNDTPSRFMLTTEMPSQVPAKVTFNFLNADREYDPDEQSAAFTAQDVKNSYTVSLPLVMTPTEALQAADVLLKKEQRERTSAGTFWLPPTDDYRKLEAADVISVIAQGRTHTIRLTKVTQLPDGRVECDGKLTASAAYTSTAQAQNSLALGQTTVPLAGSSELVLLDIPVAVSGQDAFGVSAAMYGYTQGWSGGVALRSDDSEDTWISVQGFDGKAAVFSAATPLGGGRTDIIDATSTLVITPEHDEADVFSVTETQLLAGGNLAAYGVDGRWEIVGIRTAVAGSGNYTLSNFLRGRYGTEAAMTQHVHGDKLILLETASIQFMGLPTTLYASPRPWKGVTNNAALDSAPVISYTYTGVNLKPLSPVFVKGARDAANDWGFSWVRRTRVGGEWVDTIDASLGEASESYEVDIFSDSSYTTVKRTLAGLSSASATYTSAQQTADFGASQSTVYIKVYQLSATVGRGFPAVQTLTASIPTLAPPEFGVPTSDPYWANVVLGLHCNGTHGSTSFPDARGKTVSAVGNAIVSTTQAKFGGASAYFDGNGDWLSVPSSTDFNISGVAFTLEMFAYLNASGKALVSRRSSGANGWVLNTNGIRAVMNGGWSDAQMVWTEPSLSAWHHFAWVQSGTTLYVFVDGVVAATKTGVTSIADQADALRIGSANNAGETPFNGFIDEVRFTKAAKWTENFTPPLYQYADA